MDTVSTVGWKSPFQSKGNDRGQGTHWQLSSLHSVTQLDSTTVNLGIQLKERGCGEISGRYERLNTLFQYHLFCLKTWIPQLSSTIYVMEDMATLKENNLLSPYVVGSFVMKWDPLIKWYFFPFLYPGLTWRSPVHTENHQVHWAQFKIWSLFHQNQRNQRVCSQFGGGI